MLLAAKILLTLTTLGYSVVPALFDTNSTHATNPTWDPHARFHIIWQVSSYVYLALLALFLIWTAGGDTWPLWLTVWFAVFAYGGFWTAVFARSIYGGHLVSKGNPVPHFNWNLGGKTFSTDANVTLFTGTLIVLIAGVICLIKA